MLERVDHNLLLINQHLELCYITMDTCPRDMQPYRQTSCDYGGAQPSHDAPRNIMVLCFTEMLKGPSHQNMKYFSIDLEPNGIRSC